MNSPTARSTIYFEPDLHKTLRLKAASAHRSVSDLVNEAVRQSLAEDQEDLSAFAQRVAEPTTSYEALRRGAAGGVRRRTAPAAAETAAPRQVRLDAATGSNWDTWFDGQAASDDFMPSRDQPAAQAREAL